MHDTRLLTPTPITPSDPLITPFRPPEHPLPPDQYQAPFVGSSAPWTGVSAGPNRVPPVLETRSGAAGRSVTWMFLEGWTVEAVEWAGRKARRSGTVGSGGGWYRGRQGVIHASGMFMCASVAGRSVCTSGFRRIPVMLHSAHQNRLQENNGHGKCNLRH